MLKPHPTTLRRLIRDYEELRARHAESGAPVLRQRMNDAAYTLCVTTGTRDVDTALMIAERLLARTAVIEAGAVGTAEAASAA